ncbi:thioesterase family protein [Mesorhizobium sp. WSM2239]|uniref:Thioesterase family protein n=2 Tax=unclassified Mesorhizobium TaxID=325217 RepID=A0AAU8D8V7_9HYPH
MYVWARFARMAATVKSRGPYRLGGTSRLAFRCLPTDIDFNIHLNNARYLMLADLGRMDIFLRSGLLKLMREKKWAPMMGGVQSVFVREIRLWRRFEVVSSIETWDGTQVIGRHQFILDNGETAALVMTTAGIYEPANRRFIEIDQVIAALGVETKPRQPSEAERIFMASHTGLRALAKEG